MALDKTAVLKQYFGHSTFRSGQEQVLDATLTDMCKKHPLTKEELLKVSGVGEVKLRKYRDGFLNVLRFQPGVGDEED